MNGGRIMSACALLVGVIVAGQRPAEAIHGGEDADITEFPWMVSIQVESNGGFTHNCGGTLVKPGWVLTAAHCMAIDADPSRLRDGDQLRVIVGKDKQGGQWNSSDLRRVEDPVLFPGPNGAPLFQTAPFWQGDIALLKLQEPVYDVPTVRLSYGEMPFDTALTAVGWGSTADGFFDTEAPGQLQKMDHVRVKHDVDCWDPAKADVAAVQFCTKADGGSVTNGGPRPGDSGGPALLRVGDRWIQMGVLSHLPRTCIPSNQDCGFFSGSSLGDGDPDFSGWASVSKFRDWVVQTIADEPTATDVSTALVIDSSGSMSANDPGNRRLDAANAYISASLPSDQVGVVDFDDGARVAAGLSGVDANRDILANAIATIDANGGTNLGAGLSAACDLLDDGSGQRRAAIFLTDGDGSYNGESACFADRGWPVFTIGLGTATNQALLAQIAADTGGRFLQLESSTDLVCEFQQVRAQIVGRGTTGCVPTGAIEQDATIEFLRTVGSLLLQVTFTNVWLGSDIRMTVTSPTGRVIDRATTDPDVVVAAGPTFETLTITDPEPGDWTVSLFGAEIPPGGEQYTFSMVELPKEDQELDTDGDLVADPDDVCAYFADPDQTDTDGDGDGDVCDTDPQGMQVGPGPDTSATTIAPPSEPSSVTPATSSNTVAASGDQDPATGAGVRLPVTGWSVGRWPLFAAVLVVAGALLVWAGTRRRASAAGSSTRPRT
jgi:secreted trypsin-like serine protease